MWIATKNGHLKNKKAKIPSSSSSHISPKNPSPILATAFSITTIVSSATPRRRPLPLACGPSSSLPTVAHGEGLDQVLCALTKHAPRLDTEASMLRSKHTEDSVCFDRNTYDSIESFVLRSKNKGLVEA
ncbi:hypothetical protein CDL15_Pgr018855 [Punica granatum]|nr:hypothetical protein CDL15_Pgr018855 [Punica granatum]